MVELEEILKEITSKAVVTSDDLSTKYKISKLLENNFEPIFIPPILGLLKDEREEFIQIYKQNKNVDDSKIEKIIEDYKDNIEILGTERRKLPDSTNLYKQGYNFLTWYLKDYPLNADLAHIKTALDHFYLALVGFTNYFEAILGIAICLSFIPTPANNIIEWYAKAYALNPKETMVRIIISKLQEKLHTIYTEYKKK